MAATIWVSKDGHDNNPGTKHQPMRTPWKAYAELWLEAGRDKKVVKFKGGGVYEEPLVKDLPMINVRFDGNAD